MGFNFCFTIVKVFFFFLKFANPILKLVFWHFVRNHLTRHEQERYYHIQNITTDYGRGRAWLRSAINEHSLDRYLRMLFSDENLISNYYEPSALMNDTCSRECLLTSAKGSKTLKFLLIRRITFLNSRSTLCDICSSS